MQFLRRLRGIAFATVVAASVAACSIGPAVALKTAPAANNICMDALLGGTLARHPQTGLGVTSADGQSTAVEWPFGYTSRQEGTKLALLDETGKVVAREGDQISVGGGFGNDLWHACGGVFVEGDGG